MAAATASTWPEGAWDATGFNVSCITNGVTIFVYDFCMIIGDKLFSVSFIASRIR